jgi:hypothetical protein
MKGVIPTRTPYNWSGHKECKFGSGVTFKSDIRSGAASARYYESVGTGSNPYHKYQCRRDNPAYPPLFVTQYPKEGTWGAMHGRIECRSLYFCEVSSAWVGR